MRKIDIAKKIKKFIPSFKYKVIKDSKDPRNYKVNFNKIKLFGNKNFKSIDYGIKEILTFLKNKKENISRYYEYGNFIIKKWIKVIYYTSQNSQKSN